MTRDEQIKTLALSAAESMFALPVTWTGHTEDGTGKIEFHYTFETDLTEYDRYKDADGVHRTSFVIHEDDLIEAEEPFVVEPDEYVLEEFDASAGIESIALIQYDAREIDKLKKAVVEFVALESTEKPN